MLPTRTTRAPWAPFALALLCLGLIATACLGPTDHDPTGTAPVGRLDHAIADGASIRVIGWTFDLDVTTPIEVKVSVGGVITTHRADRARPDVAKVYPRFGPNHGYDIRTGPLPKGKHQVCVWAVNVARGTQDRVLGCPDVVIGAGDSPVGELESVSQSGPARVRVTGWGYDPEAADSVAATVTVDGTAHRIRADQMRSDLKAWFKKSGRHGISVDLPAAVGNRKVCLTIHNVGRGADAAAGCRTIAVNDQPRIAPGMDVASVEPVAPPAGHPLARIDRDAGVSTQLRDGSILWLFGDSHELAADDALKYFVNNTAALSTPGSPAATLDAVAARPAPHLFVAPVAAPTVACPSGYRHIMWPLSSVAVPDGESSRDRVIAFFGNVCVNSTDMRGRGVAVVEWIHDPTIAPASGGIGRRIQGRVLEQNLFPIGAEYGTAALVVGDHVYAYQCNRPADGRTEVAWPDDPAYSGCTVARALPQDVATASAWQYWRGGEHTSPASWSSVRADAATMDVPGMPGSDRQMPVSSFSVVEDPHHGTLFVYSPWPGYTDRVTVRTGDSPVGPWSPTTTIRFPGCNEWAHGSGRYCYAGTAQPWRSTATTLGVGYFDQLIATPPLRGGYLAASAPFSAGT